MASGNPVAPFDRALNAGVGGQTSGQIADRVTAAAPIVFLEGGINDQLRDEIVPNYRRMLDKLTGVRVVISGIPPVDEALLDVDLAKIINNAKIAKINAQLANLCSILKLPDSHRDHTAICLVKHLMAFIPSQKHMQRGPVSSPST